MVRLELAPENSCFMTSMAACTLCSLVEHIAADALQKV